MGKNRRTGGILLLLFLFAFFFVNEAYFLRVLRAFSLI